MLPKNLIDKLKLTALGVAAIIAVSGCSLIKEDLPECPAMLQLRFVYNYNLLKADAFATQVKSVYVWAFDDSGNFIWSDSAHGEILTEPNFIMDTPLGAGTYDFVAWCGLEGNDDFSLAAYSPSSKEDLEVKLKTINEGGKNVSSSHFSDLFHGSASNVNYVVDPLAPSFSTITIPLIKDTNDIAVMLQNYDGSPINRDDFSVKFTYADSWLAWDNNILSVSPTVTYTPWNILYGETSITPSDTNINNNIISTLLFEMSSCRLMVGGDAYLDVIRNSDNTTIIHIPLIEFFLLEKGDRYNQFGDQEYLDRRDDYSALFFLQDGSWYTAGGIYINGWAVVPPQNAPL